MSERVKQTFSRTFESLEKIFALVDEFAGVHALDGSAKYSVSFVLEELFTNMVKYNPDGTGDIVIELERKDDAVVMIVEDHSVTPFDLTKRGPVDTSEDLSQRNAGGLGIHLVQQIADKVEYQFDNGVSTITVTKHLKG